MGVKWPKREKAVKRRTAANTQRSWDKQGTHFCIPYETDRHEQALLGIFDRYRQSPNILPFFVRYGEKEAYQRMRHGKSPTHFRRMTRGDRAVVRVNPNKTATLNNLLVFAVPDGNVDTLKYLNWHLRIHKELRDVFRHGSHAIRVYSMPYKNKGIAAGYVNGAKIRKDMLPCFRAANLQARTLNVDACSWMTLVENVTDEWEETMCGLGTEACKAVLVQNPDLQQFEVEVLVEKRLWCVGGKERLFVTKHDANAFAEETRAKESPAATDVAERGAKPVEGSKKASAEARDMAEDGQRANLFWLKKGLKAAKNRQAIAREDANMTERKATKFKNTLDGQHDTLSVAEAELTKAPTDAEKKKRVVQMRQRIKVQTQKVADAKADAVKARAHALEVEKQYKEQERARDAVQDMTPEQWAVHNEKERLAREKASVDEDVDAVWAS